MRTRADRVFGLFMLVVAALLAPLQASAGSFDRFVVFGDSLSDPGNAYAIDHKVTVPPYTDLVPTYPYARGMLHFSNGPTWVEQLSLIDHAFPSAGPAYLIPGLFSNYAVGRARARPDPTAPGNGVYDLSSQVQLFLRESHHHRAPSNALYIVWIGGNDVRDAIGAYLVDPNSVRPLLDSAGQSIYMNVLSLYQAGARRFLIPNVPDLSKAPAIVLAGEQAATLAQVLTSQFNAGVDTAVASLGSLPDVEIVRFDVFQLLDQIAASPAAFRLRNAASPCIDVLATKPPYACARPENYMFWDGVHPTTAGHRIIAEHAYEVLKAHAMTPLPH